MLVMSKNDIAFDNLDAEDLEQLEKAKDDAVIEILEGDESIQRVLGEIWGVEDLKTFEPGDRLVTSYLDEASIPFSYQKKKGYYSGEFIYECI